MILHVPLAFLGVAFVAALQIVQPVGVDVEVFSALAIGR